MRIRYFTIFRIYKYSIYSVYNFMKLSRPLYNFLIVSFAWYRKYIIFLNSFRKFSDALFAFTCVSTIGNFWSSCLEPNMLSLFPLVTFLLTSTAVTHKFLPLKSIFILAIVFFCSSDLFPVLFCFRCLWNSCLYHASSTDTDFKIFKKS